ncbi:hypothetical protein ENBRE01_2621 [Enteropsectra breve]|nr:hypothetical protein ENBRE01_2621 [Enteropsectra breve]
MILLALIEKLAAGAFINISMEELEMRKGICLLCGEMNINELKASESNPNIKEYHSSYAYNLINKHCMSGEHIGCKQCSCIFHLKCFKKVYSRSNAFECPKCKAVIKEQDYLLYKMVLAAKRETDLIYSGKESWFVCADGSIEKELLDAKFLKLSFALFIQDCQNSLFQNLHFILFASNPFKISKLSAMEAIEPRHIQNIDEAFMVKWCEHLKSGLCSEQKVAIAEEQTFGFFEALVQCSWKYIKSTSFTEDIWGPYYKVVYCSYFKYEFKQMEFCKAICRQVFKTQNAAFINTFIDQIIPAIEKEEERSAIKNYSNTLK